MCTEEIGTNWTSRHCTRCCDLKNHGTATKPRLWPLFSASIFLHPFELAGGLARGGAGRGAWEALVVGKPFSKVKQVGILLSCSFCVLLDFGRISNPSRAVLVSGRRTSAGRTPTPTPCHRPVVGSANDRGYDSVHCHESQLERMKKQFPSKTIYTAKDA